ncbi:carboxymuconolactone decarboxylase family protein [Rahnella ecdela]|uniref:Carboxymuconolactone decarboxylase family protein n=1 Tax=Rahnella ecdela TaxID=2816250 RepID=A0ABS6LAE5_9GAMM|nr:carboxymuconolactone decarboxylase family protein [Rahnella ecdela]MBU9843908.1 carboxymuconolactone decarboxylase family protein [Rahnella ecdela]
MKILLSSFLIFCISNAAIAKDDITQRSYDDVQFKNNLLTTNQTNYLKIPKDWAHAYGSDSTTLTHLDANLAELVRLRVGQLDNCNYCVILHTRQTVKLGIPTAKVSSLSTWQQSHLFTDKEKAALAFAESLSGVNHANFQPAYEKLIEAKFSNPEIEELTNVVILMNIWSRIFMVQGKFSERPSE